MKNKKRRKRILELLKIFWDRYDISFIDLVGCLSLETYGITKYDNDEQVIEWLLCKLQEGN